MYIDIMTACSLLRAKQHSPCARQTVHIVAMSKPMAQSRTPGARPRTGDRERKKQRLADQAALDSARALPDMWSAIARPETEDTGSESHESWCDRRKPGEEGLRAILKSWQLRNRDWNGHDIFQVSLELLLEERISGRVPLENIGIMSTLVGSYPEGGR